MNDPLNELLDDTQNKILNLIKRDNSLTYNYWSSEKQKDIIRKKLYDNEEIYQRKLSEKYNPNALFKNKATKIETVENSVAMVEYKESIFAKIKNWFKRTF